jgi:hypothetical protein
MFKNMPLQSMSSYSSTRKLNPMSSAIIIPKSNKTSTNNLDAADNGIVIKHDFRNLICKCYLYCLKLI